LSIFIAILGLGLLILVHEAGHFFASLAVGLRPRRFYVGFPPAILRRTRNNIEYGLGAIPLGGFVTIPGMHRPIPHDAEKRFSRAVSEAPALAGPVDRVRRELEGSDPHAALPDLDDVERVVAETKLSPDARMSAEKGLTELRDALGPDAYWKAPTWKRLVAIAAGPFANIALAIVLLTVLFMTSAGKATSEVASVVPTFETSNGASIASPASKAGLQAGDRILTINGKRVDAEDIPDVISDSEGKALTIVVRRDGQEVTLGQVAPLETSSGYRLGFVLGGTGLGPVEAVERAFRFTGLVTVEIGKALARLAIGEGREDVSSPIGIVQASSDSVERGAESYLGVLSLISLSLALLNLLPLLPLDGGHILFALVEGARGRLVRREIYERVSVVGLAVVLLLFFIGLTNDIGRLS
jgi:membrane-associated protease RseP (regulator of RpoE activity)